MSQRNHSPAIAALAVALAAVAFVPDRALAFSVRRTDAFGVHRLHGKQAGEKSVANKKEATFDHSFNDCAEPSHTSCPHPFGHNFVNSYEHSHEENRRTNSGLVFFGD